MYLFFHGPNDYLIKKQVDALKDRYKQKNAGDLNLLTLDGEQIVPELFLAEVLAVPLLASSRLIIVKNIFKNRAKTTLDKIKDSLDKIPPSTVVIFVESGSPDKRLGLFKALNKPKVAKEFNDLSRAELLKFIEVEALSRGLKINQNVAEYLADSVGLNLWQISNEIEKLANFCAGRALTRANIDALVVKNISSDAFRLADNLLRAQKKEALGELENLLISGEPPLKILGLINYQFRSLAQVMSALKTTDNQFQIAKLTTLAPFQVAKFLPIAKKTSWPDLSKIYKLLVRIDEAIKTGIIEGGEGLKSLLINL